MAEIKDSNRIYLTYKARIIAEAKFRRLSIIANLLIIWYSFLMIAISITSGSDLISISYFETILACVSVGIFASSTFLATGILQRQADSYRACYLELQQIWNSSVTEAEKMKRYGAALLRYPNHTSRDDSDLIASTWRRGGKLYDTTGEVPVTAAIISGSIFRSFLFWSSAFILFIAPVIAGAYLIRPS